MRRVLRFLLPWTIVATMVAGAVVASHPGRELGGPLPNGSPPLPDQQVKVDGKVYEKTARTRVRLSAKDLQLAHDGVIRHAVGRAFGPPTNFNAGGNYGTQDWWIEGEAYILHRQEWVGNPPVQQNYYRAGFDLFSWRGGYDTEWGDEFPALNDWDIYFGLVSHPNNSPLTTNQAGPYSVFKTYGAPGNYTCQGLTQEVFIPWSLSTIIRTNLWVRPRFVYWQSGQNPRWATIPYGQVRRLTQSFGLWADGNDSVVFEDYTGSWSESMAIPANTQPYPRCAAEVLQDPPPP